MYLVQFDCHSYPGVQRAVNSCFLSLVFHATTGVMSEERGGRGGVEGERYSGIARISVETEIRYSIPIPYGD